MRDIKFRAWDKATNSMILPEDKESWKLYLDGGSSINSVWATRDVELMQFTGLTDVDGVDIYESDVIKTVATANDHHQRGATDIVVVRYFMGNACLCFPDYETGVTIYPFNVTSTLEVIGNIHENPELLEQ